jgi:hypothetical protein
MIIAGTSESDGVRGDDDLGNCLGTRVQRLRGAFIGIDPPGADGTSMARIRDRIGRRLSITATVSVSRGRPKTRC